MENGEPVQSEIKGLEPSLLTGGRKSRSRKNRTRRNKRGGDGCQASLDAPTFGGSKKSKKGGKKAGVLETATVPFGLFAIQHLIARNKKLTKKTKKKLLKKKRVQKKK